MQEVAPAHRVEVLAALEVEVVRGGVGCGVVLQCPTFLGAQRHLQRIDDAAGDVVLDREHVLHLAVVGFRPEVRVGSGIDQLRRDAHVLAGAAYAAFEYRADARSEEHTSELQSLMRISYAVFCLKKKKKHIKQYNTHERT